MRVKRAKLGNGVNKTITETKYIPDPIAALGTGFRYK